MVKIIAQFFIKEDRLDEAISLGKELLIESKKEDRCLNFEFYQDEQNKTHLIFIEEWNSELDLMHHFVTPHFTNFVIKIDKLKSKERIIESFTKII